MPEQLLYHYTSYKKLKAIVESKTLWLTDIINSNDAEEVLHTFDNLWKSIKPSLLSYFAGNDYALKMIEMADSQMETEIQSVTSSLFDMKPFGVCFSINRDLAQNWNEYGDHTRGVALGFNRNVLKGIQREIPHPNAVFDRAIGWYPVYYNNKALESGFIQLFEEMIPRAGNLAWMQIRTTLKHYSAFIKNPSYRDEREVRIIYYPDEQHDLSYTSCKLEAFKEEPIPHSALPWANKNCLKEIMIGTNCPNDEEDIIKMLNDNEICTDGITISHSKYPYKLSHNK